MSQSGPPEGSASSLRQWRRPAVVGLSVGHPSGSVGSIGPFVVNPDGRIGFVSTSFVLAPEHSRPGDYIHQPGPSHIEILTRTTRVAKLAMSVSPAEGGVVRVAAAVAEFLAGEEPKEHVLPGESGEAGRALSSVLEPSELSVGEEVAFVGCGSGYSRGRIVQPLRPEIKVEKYVFGPVITVEGDSGAFSRPGDGGALVYRCADCRAIGLLVARQEKGERPRSVILPLGPALDALGVRLLT